jgi:UDP-N-acetyl-D-mannosaminuronic acid dehydrogenase
VIDKNRPFEAGADDSVCVLGLGYVGLTLATVLSDVGYRVTGVDRDTRLIADVKAGKPHFHEKGLEEMMKAITKLPRPPVYQTGLPESCAAVYVITVGTPILRPSLKPNLEYVRSATAEVAKVLRKGDLVILRSTVPVGTTRQVALPMLESTSGLKAGVDFDLAFCPERTIEGKALRELRELPQIVGGINEAARERAARLFRRSTQTIIDVGSLESAEMLKIMDNTYRDVMFAYANQMALLCEGLGLDLVPLVRAANQGYNRNRIPVPSPGVGGACLSKDPYILASVCENAGVDASLFLLGRRINESMPVHTVDRVAAELQAAGKRLAGAEVLVLGFAFKGKPETSDMRDSPTIDLVRVLRERGAQVRGHDPLVPAEEIAALGVRVCALEEGFGGADAVIVMLNHDLYEEMDIAGLLETTRKPVVVVDGWHIFNSDDVADLSGVTYRCIGR